MYNVVHDSSVCDPCTSVRITNLSQEKQYILHLCNAGLWRKLHVHTMYAGLWDYEYCIKKLPPKVPNE